MGLMGMLTLALYGGALFYFGGAKAGAWNLNMSLLTTYMTVATFGFWCAVKLKPATGKSLKSGARTTPGGIGHARVVSEREPMVEAFEWWVSWTVGMFPVFLLVLVVRTFLVEPFFIPSPSMVPTLQVGDAIAVNKFAYGLRLPLMDEPIFSRAGPSRGDVIVFRYPVDPSLDYIKRVIGVPGDEVSYLDGVLRLNGAEMKTRPFEDANKSGQVTDLFVEDLGAASHMTQRDHIAKPLDALAVKDFPNKDLCRYDEHGVVCKVPNGNYFVMGDNRDHSEDSRYWGFVPSRNIAGKAFMIWMSHDGLKRVGSFQ